MYRCQWLKNDGQQCTRTFDEKTQFCWQHIICQKKEDEILTKLKIPMKTKLKIPMKTKLKIPMKTKIKIPMKKEESPEFLGQVHHETIPMKINTTIPLKLKEPAKHLIQTQALPEKIPASCPAIPYDYYKNFYSISKSQEIFDHLSTLDYDYTYYYLFGKVRKSPRKMLWFAENPAWTYYFSRNHINGLPVNPFTPFLTAIKRDVEDFTGHKFNALLINEYEQGNTIDWHSDDDPWYGQDFIVPSLSFGSEKNFLLRLKADHSVQLSIRLENDSLINMKDQCQNLWQHAIMKQSGAGIRYNLTFRAVKPSLVSKQHQGFKKGKYIANPEQYLGKSLPK
jgi:alkylated DNA repair dioxygenase AlkB